MNYKENNKNQKNKEYQQNFDFGNEFLEYIKENFEISGEAYRFIINILNYIKSKTKDEKEQYFMACELLDGTIGLSENELRKFFLKNSNTVVSECREQDCKHCLHYVRCERFVAELNSVFGFNFILELCEDFEDKSLYYKKDYA